jgi:hypothetical protein
MPTINLGRVGIVNKGTYVGGTTIYKMNDICKYNNSVYICTQAHSIEHLPIDNAYWTIWIDSVNTLHPDGAETITGVKTFSAQPVGIVKDSVGLGNVDNTTDLLKPISTATQTALDLKADLTSAVLVTPNIGVASGTSFNNITALASVTSPMDGIATVGTSTTVARQDHIHPTDTSRSPIDSPTFTGVVTVPTPVNATDAATKGYVDGAIQGLDIKNSVRLASTDNIALSTGTLLTIDGVTTVAGDRVLVKNQTTASENGIYVAGTGAWSRSIDADTSSEVTTGMYIYVAEGAVNAGTGFVLTTPAPITLNTTSLSFTAFSGAGQVIVGNGLSETGNIISINTGITADLSTAQTLSNKTLVTPNIGVASGTSFNSITALASTAPIMDGTATVGTGTTVARADHIHPIDTSRAPIDSPALTGTPTAPTAPVGTSNTQLATTAFVVANSVQPTEYATSTIGGTVKMRISGNTLYLTNDGTDA